MLHVESVYRTPTDSDGISPQVEPCRLWSLWDMLHHLFVLILFRERTIENRQKLLLPGLANEQATLSPGVIGALTDWLKCELTDSLAREGFQATALVIDKILQRKGVMTYQELSHRLNELEENFKSDCHTRWVYVVPENAQNIFVKKLGPAQLDADFPEAAAEASEANKCFALGRYTGCVFHMMRAVEYAMRAMAVAVGMTAVPRKIPLELEQWNVVIEGIASKTRTAPDSWGPFAKVNGRAFFNATISDLYGFKDDTRNVLMHARDDMYDYGRAHSVRTKFYTFFERLNGRVAEDGSRNPLDESLFQP